jgi:membrane associated rhomboid family serine protease
MGHARFVVFYLICGVAAAATQIMIDPHSRVPMVGASGAISGILGAYVLLYPKVRVHTLLFLGFFVTTIVLPAYVMLGYWFLLQLAMGTMGTLSHVQGGVAVWAHVGGFIAGIVLIKLFTNPELTQRRQTANAAEWWRR